MWQSYQKLLDKSQYIACTKCKTCECAAVLINFCSLTWRKRVTSLLTSHPVKHKFFFSVFAGQMLLAPLLPVRFKVELHLTKEHGSHSWLPSIGWSLLLQWDTCLRQSIRSAFLSRFPVFHSQTIDDLAPTYIANIKWETNDAKIRANTRVAR